MNKDYRELGNYLSSKSFWINQRPLNTINLQQTEKISLLQYLVKNKILSAEQIALTAAQNFGVPMIDLNCIESGFNTLLIWSMKNLFAVTTMVPLI